MKTAVRSWLSRICAWCGRVKTALAAGWRGATAAGPHSLETGERGLSEIFALCKRVQEAFASDPMMLELNNAFRKFLFVVAASRLEFELKECLATLLDFDNNIKGRILLTFVKKGPGEVFDLGQSPKGQNKSYSDNKAPDFYRKFGKEFAKFMADKEKNSKFAKARRDFTLIMKARNVLVHGDISSKDATNAMPEWTVEEVEKGYRSASCFLRGFRKYALKFAERKQPDGDSPVAP